MQDTDFKTWALIAALALGGTLQIAKSFRPTPARHTAEVSAAFAEADDEPYSVRAEARPRPAGRPTVAQPTTNVDVAPEQMAKFIAQNQAPAQAGTFTEKGDEKKKLKCVKKIDPTTGLEVEVCKKKKKKKKADPQTAETTPITSPVVKPADDGGREAGIAWGVANVVATNQLNVNTKQPDTAFESLAYWEKLLLDQANLAETKRFIDHFQRNLVTGDVFYDITKKMMADPRSDMKLLGELCASQSPSVMSFQLLADLVESSASGSSVRGQADSALARYTDLTTLNILAAVMRANDSTFAATIAVQKLGVTATRYLKVATTDQAKDQTKPSSAARNKAYFNRFVTILQGLSKSADDSLKTAASGTLSTLQNLLNQAGPTNPPATAVAQS